MDRKKLDELLEEFEGYKNRIGGRDCDIEQLALTLSRHVKNQFHINEVPDHLIMALDILRKKIVIAKNAYIETIETIKSEFRQIFEEEELSRRYVNPDTGTGCFQNELKLCCPFVCSSNMSRSIDYKWLVDEVIKRNGTIDLGTLMVFEQLAKEEQSN